MNAKFSTPVKLTRESVAARSHKDGTWIVPVGSWLIATDSRVSFTGVENFAFTWSNNRYEVVYADLQQQDIFVVHLSATGQMLDAPLAIDQTPAASSLPNILPTRTGYVVAWTEAGAQPHVRTHALDLSGRPTGTSHVIAYGRSPQMRPVLARSPLGTAISWMDQVEGSAAATDDVGDSTTYVALLDDDVRLRADVPPQRVNAASRSGYPWLAGDGKTLALLWSDEQLGRSDTYFAPLDGQLKAEEMINVRDPAAEHGALLGRLTLTDVGYLAAWEDHRSGEEEIYMALLDPSGNRYAGGLVEEPGTGSANWPHLAWTGSAAGVVYYQFRGGKPQIFITFVDQNGARVGGAADAQISNTTEWARYPDVVWNGSEFGVLWIDARAGQPDLYFNRAVCHKPAPI